MGEPDAGEGTAGDASDGGQDGDDASVDGGGDGGVVTTSCAEPVAPTQTRTLTGQSNLNTVIALRAHDQVFVRHSKLSVAKWWRWSASTWVEETIPWPSTVPATSRIARTVQGLDGSAVIMTDTHLMTFDGTTMGNVIALPAVDNPYDFARDPAGRYHVFHANFETVSRSDGTWESPASIPVPATSGLPAAATVMASGRVVVVYVAGDERHVYARSRTPGGTWSAAQDLTPTWAVRASRPIVYAPPAGGVVVAANGESIGGVVWRSSDGVAFGASHQLGIMFPTAVSGECLDGLAISAGYQTRFELFGFKQGAWTSLASRTLNYIFDGDVAMLPNGKTYWALGETNWVEYYATP